MPIVAVVSQTEKNKVNVPSKAPTCAVDGAVKGVLSGKFLEGLTTMINGALNTVLGSSFGGEMEKQDFHVVFAKNSLLRIDYLIYKYEFSSKGIKKTAKNAFCYYLQVVCWIWRRRAHRFSCTRSPWPLRRTRLLKSKNDLRKWVNSLRICTQECCSLRCLRPLVRYLRWEGPRKCRRA